MNIFLRPILSDSEPETNLKLYPVNSADPSIAPNIALDAPKSVIMNRGRIPDTISVEKSVKRLTIPKIVTFLMPTGFGWSFDPLYNALLLYFGMNKDMQKRD